MTRAYAGLLACAALVAGVAVGCGGAPGAGPKSPPAAPGTMSEPTSTGAGGGAGSVAAPMPSGNKEPGADGMVDDVAHAQLQFEDSHKAFTAASGDCASMCKALSSMQRAADHLCGLTKDGADSEKKRCDDAQAKVDGAKERVKSTCGGCG